MDSYFFLMLMAESMLPYTLFSSDRLSLSFTISLLYFWVSSTDACRFATISFRPLYSLLTRLP